MTPVAREDLRLLAEVGVLALSRCQLARAETIFSALALARPALDGGYVGLAAAQVFAGRPREALDTLDRGLRAVPAGEQAQLRAFQGFTLRCMGMNEAGDRALRAAGDLPLALALLGQRAPLAKEA